MFLVDLIELRHAVSAIGTVKRSELEVRQAQLEAELEFVKAVWEGVAHLRSISASQDYISQILGGVMKGTDELRVDLGGERSDLHQRKCQRVHRRRGWRLRV